MNKTWLISVVGALLIAASCQNVTTPRPAVLVNQDAASMALIKEAAAQHLGRAKVDIGAGDLTKQSTISVLPPRVTAMEGNSAAMPKTLQLRARANDCYLFDETERRATLVRELVCRAID